MALRLTGTTLTTPEATAPVAVTAQSLAAQARMALGRGDVAGYATLFGAIESLTDPQRRFEACLTLLDAGLSQTATAPEALAVRIFAAAAEASLDALDGQPAEPLLLNLAGVALYELWSLDAAQALFRAARRLDPALADADRNLVQLARRRQSARRPQRPLHAAVTGLARRAQAIARRAQPASGLTLSLCMIVRDEEEMLARCLEAVAPAVDEMIIVDTGSVDATVEIARSFGARVIEHPWTGSFSEARNVSFDAATGDWLLYLDADEILVAEDVQTLRSLLARTWREAFYLVETSYTGELGDSAAIVNNALRVFRNRPAYRFKDRLHEQIIHTLPTYVPGRLESSSVRVSHYGYLGSVREAKEKSRRNVELLKIQAAESPASAFLHFNLGSEYTAAGDPATAIQEFTRARTMLTAEGTLARSDFAAPLMTRMVLALRLCGRLQEARAAADEGLALFEDLTDLVLAKARIARAFGDAGEAIALYERCIDLGDAPPRYGGTVGCGTFQPRLDLAELHLARGETTAARDALQWCLEHHPDFLAVAGPYTTTLLRAGQAPEKIVAALDRLESHPPAVRLAIAGALRSGGAAKAAEDQYRLALLTAPGHARARTSLAELLLGRGAWDEAAGLAADVPDDDPHAALASRIELCSLIGRAPAAVIDAGFQRAARVGLPQGERAVLAAWAKLTQGDELAQDLPVAGAPLLAVMLQTLLGAGDGARFVGLLPALSRCGLDRREQQELLGEMYLRHGLLDRAAEQWMAASSPAPDARSLYGLARVAQRHGLVQDAAVFARGALELDAACSGARDLLGALEPLIATPA